jgi:hypothetical protein
MKIKKGKISCQLTITIEKDDNILFDKDWLSNGHVMISRQNYSITMKGLDDIQSAAWFGGKARSDRGHGEATISTMTAINLSNFPENGKTVTVTSYAHVDDNYITQLCIINNELIVINSKYIPLIDDNDLIAKDETSPIYCKNGDNVVSIVMPFADIDTIKAGLLPFKKIRHEITIDMPAEWLKILDESEPMRDEVLAQLQQYDVAVPFSSCSDTTFLIHGVNHLRYSFIV